VVWSLKRYIKTEVFAAKGAKTDTTTEQSEKEIKFPKGINKF
jgi:hypothetical protein